MEWNWNLSIGFRQEMSETMSVGGGLSTSVGSTVDVPDATCTNTIGDSGGCCPGLGDGSHSRDNHNPIEWRHEMQRIRAWFIVGLSLLILGVPVPGGAQDKNTLIDPQADSILRQMSDYMNTLGQFIVRAEDGADTLLATGQALQLGRSVEVFVRRPDRLRGNIDGGRFDQEFYYDGQSITLFTKKVNYYATTEAPSTIGAALDDAEQSVGLVAPFADLISKDAYDTLIEDVTVGLYVGLNNVLGVECHHLAFRGEETDWQIWIENSEKPLPRKMVITSKWVTGAPRFVGLITGWDLSPELKDSLFTFIAPEGAEEIEFLPPDN